MSQLTVLEWAGGSVMIQQDDVGKKWDAIIVTIAGGAQRVYCSRNQTKILDQVFETSETVPIQGSINLTQKTNWKGQNVLAPQIPFDIGAGTP